MPLKKIQYVFVIKNFNFKTKKIPAYFLFKIQQQTYCDNLKIGETLEKIDYELNSLFSGFWFGPIEATKFDHLLS